MINIIKIDITSIESPIYSDFFIFFSDNSNNVFLVLMLMKPIKLKSKYIPIDILKTTDKPMIIILCEIANNMTINETGHGTMPADMPVSIKFFLNSTFFSCFLNLLISLKIKKAIAIKIIIKPLAKVK